MGKAKRRARISPDERRYGRRPDRPTEHYPGSVAKLDVMADRLLRGESLFHPGDARSRHDEDTVPTKTHRLIYSGSTRRSQVKEKIIGKPHDWVNQRKVTSYILSDKQWRKIKKLVPLKRGLNGTQKAVALNQHRNAINGIFFVLFRGIAWADLPERYCYFGIGNRGHHVNRVWHAWRATGRWAKMLRTAGVVDKEDRIQWHKLQMTSVQA